MCSVSDDQALVAGNVVGPKSFVEQAAIEQQGISRCASGRVTDQHLASLYCQSTAAVDAIAANLSCQQQLTGASGHIGIGGQSQVAAFTAALLASVQQGCARGHIHHTAGREAQIMVAA